MEAQRRSHPAPEVLRALAAGDLDGAAADTASAHLERCPACRAAVAAFSGDRSSGSTAPGTRGTGDTHSAQDAVPTVSYAPADVLPELRDHPQYEVVRELGRGGMGVVYLARNKLLDRLEVLKVVGKQLLGSPGAAERFQREIRSAAKLSHPHIVTAHAAFQAGDLLVFAMEYVEGETLAQVVKARGRLPVVNACYYARQVAEGLQHAHDRGMVHRDIKPQNLILARQGKKHTVKVLDFGLAKATREGREGDRDLTGAGALLGTPDYVAPEQALDAATADIRADIYSLGCTLYFLLSGAPPFQEKSTIEILQAHLTKDAVPLDRVRADVPAALAAEVAKMMAKDPARRYQKPAEVVQALAPFVRSNPGPVNPSPAAEPPAPKEATEPPVVEATLIEASNPVPRARPRREARPSSPEPARPASRVPRGLVLGAVALLGVLVLGAGAVYLLNKEPKAEKGTAQGGEGDKGSDAGSSAVKKVPANLRTTVEFVDYELTESRWNGRVWEFTVRARCRQGDQTIRFSNLKVVTDQDKTIQLPRYQAVREATTVSEEKPVEIKMSMSTIPPGTKKLTSVELQGMPGNTHPYQPVIFHDVPIEPDRDTGGRKVPANLRTTVDFVDYEVAGSRWNGRVWEFSVRARCRQGDQTIRFFMLRVLTDKDKTFELPRAQVMKEATTVSEEKPVEIKMTMSTIPPGTKKLARVELIGLPGNTHPYEPVVFLDVPIDPDPEQGRVP